jgi:hypothetical protein
MAGADSHGAGRIAEFTYEMPEVKPGKAMDE